MLLERANECQPILNRGKPQVHDNDFRIAFHKKLHGSLAGFRCPNLVPCVFENELIERQ